MELIFKQNHNKPYILRNKNARKTPFHRPLQESSQDSITSDERQQKSLEKASESSRTLLQHKISIKSAALDVQPLVQSKMKNGRLSVQIEGVAGLRGALNGPEVVMTALDNLRT